MLAVRKAGQCGLEGLLASLAMPIICTLAKAGRARREFTVPLCRGHNREVHGCDDEVACWRKSGIDPTVAARELWLENHPLSGGAGASLADAENSLTIGAGDG